MTDTENRLLIAEKPSDYYFRLPEVVWYDKDLSANAKILYMVISGLARTTRECWASNATLSEKTFLSERAIQIALKQLAEQGLVQVTYEGSGNTKRTIFIPHIDDVYSFDSEEKTAPSDDHTPEGDAGGTPAGGAGTPARGATPPAGDAGVPPHDVRPNTTNVNTTTQHDNSTNVLLPSVVSEKPWDLWSAYGTANEVDLKLATERQQKIALRDAKALIADGVTAADVTGCVEYLRGQTWRTSPVTFQIVVKEIGEWRMAGRPGGERKPAKSQGAFDAYLAAKTQPSPNATTASGGAPDRGDVLEADVRSIR